MGAVSSGQCASAHQLASGGSELRDGAAQYLNLQAGRRAGGPPAALRKRASPSRSLEASPGKAQWPVAQDCALCPAGLVPACCRPLAGLQPSCAYWIRQ